MSETIKLVLFLILAVAFIIFIRWLIRYSNERLEKQRRGYRELAKANGWSYEEPGKDVLCRLCGRDPVNWQLDLEMESSNTDTSSSTKWSTNDIVYEDLVAIIRTRKGFELLQSMFGRAASSVLSMMTNVIGVPTPQHDELIQTGHRLTPQSSDVSEEFVIVVRDESLGRMLTQRVEAALRAWKQIDINEAQKDTFSIDVGQSNLRVYCRWTIEPHHAQQFIDTGLAVAAALKS